MTQITNEGHAERLEYGWWEPKRGHVLLPATLGDERNYVLTPVEMAAYDWLLMRKKADIEKESADIAYTVRCLRHGRMPVFEQRNPRCFTLCDMLEFEVKEKRTELEMMQLLLYMTKRAVDERNARQRERPLDAAP